jgi:hypothetical protein
MGGLSSLVILSAIALFLGIRGFEMPMGYQEINRPFTELARCLSGQSLQR